MTTSHHLYPTRFRVLEGMASEVIAKHMEAASPEPPVNVGLLAKSLGLAVERADLSALGPDVLGALSLDDLTIYTDRGVVGTRARFTIAHEIGHFLLHAKRTGGLLTRKSSTVQAATVLCGREGSGLSIEREADFFAGALLIPVRQLNASGLADATVGELATAFQVSLTALKIRLEQIHRYNLGVSP